MHFLGTKGCRVSPNENKISAQKAFSFSFDTFKVTERNKEEWPCPLKCDFAQLSELSISKVNGETQDSRKIEISIRIVTWNQQAKTPPSSEELNKHLLLLNKFDLIAIGCQECENTMVMSALIPSKTKWEANLNNIVGSEYEMICSHSLQAMHM